MFVFYLFCILAFGCLKFRDKHLQMIEFVSQLMQIYLCILLFIVTEFSPVPQYGSEVPAKECGVPKLLFALSSCLLY
jgi:hypothetical protein